MSIVDYRETKITREISDDFSRYVVALFIGYSVTHTRNADIPTLSVVRVWDVGFQGVMRKEPSQSWQFFEGDEDDARAEGIEDEQGKKDVSWQTSIIQCWWELLLLPDVWKGGINGLLKLWKGNIRTHALLHME